METIETIAGRLERCFADIQQQRMSGIPILNDALRVRAIGMRDWQDYWLCALLTPWFMNVMMLARGAGEAPATVGAKRMFAFPAGQFEFICGHEPVIGAYWMCSLFSPVLEFADQESAEATAALALEAMLDAAQEDSAEERDMAMIWRGEGREAAPASDTAVADDVADGGSEPATATVSRRALLTGRVAREEQAWTLKDA